ncbi:MAG: tetratricopeptide repeat protein [Candidatus Omnitrophica bacterium]|nr:tetratricopeptide repeat protein [Candidatus Omnitrophota bacterium]
MNKRIEPLDWLRGLMALSIMFYHLILFNFGQPSSSSIVGRLSIYGVSIFFVISGLTNAVICERCLEGLSSVISFYMKRLFRILPLFWLCIPLTIFVLHLSWDGWRIFLNLSMLFSIGDPKAAIPIGGWSIGNEMVYYALTPAFIWLYRKNKRLGDLLFFGSFIIAMYFSLKVLHLEESYSGQFFKAWCHPLNNLFYYLAGVSLFYNSGSFTINKWCNYFLLICFVLLFIFTPVFGDLIHVMYGFNRVIFSICSIGIVFCFYHIEVNFPLRINKILSLFGMATYSVYLLHPIIYAGFLNILNAVGIHDAISKILVGATFTCIISMYSFRYFESFFIELGKKISDKILIINPKEFIDFGGVFMKNNYFKLFSIASVLCLGVLVYSNTFHAAFQMDDNPSIIDNLAIRNMQNLSQIWSFWPCRFLTYLSIAFNYQYSHLDVVGYHILNLIVHLGSAMLVFWFVLLTLSTPVMKANRIAPYANGVALWVSLVFVSHPLQTEAVTYIVQRATSLAAFFYLASLCLYVKARVLQEGRDKSGHERYYYILALILAVMAMFTKEMAITLPLMILLYEISFLKTNKTIDWKKLIPFMLTIVIIPMTMVMTKYIDFQNLKRAGEQAQNIDSIHYLLTQFRVIVTYLRLLVVPIHQNLDYDFPVSKSFFELSTLGSFLVLAAILYTAKRLFRNYRLLSFSIFFFFLSLLPESSILPIKDVIFEHRLYLPMLGYGLLLVGGLTYLWEKKSFLAVGIVLTLIIGVNSLLTYERNKVWQDMYHLWDDTAAKSPHKERPRSNRGLSNDILGNYKEALEDYRKAKELNPKFPEAYYNSGVVYTKMGKIPQAIAEYNRAIELNPSYADAYCNLGTIYSNQGHFDLALLNYINAINTNPYKAVFYKNRANTLSKLNRLSEAVSDYTVALKLDPLDITLYNNRGAIYDQLGNPSQAVLDYTKAIALNPHLASIYLNRGNSNNKLGRLTEALKDYNQAISLNPNYPDAYGNLAITYYQLRIYDKALESLNRLEQFKSTYDSKRIEQIRKLLTEKK